MNDSMHLSVRDDTRFRAIAISGAHTDTEGVVSQRFRKTIVRAGDVYKHSEGQTFSIRKEHLENWALQFKRMKADGIAVRIPATHARANDPDATRGVVDDMFVVDDDTLMMSCTMYGQDGIDAAMRNDVSINAVKEYVSDKHVTYPNPIRHVALCPDPVVSGLGEFIRIAASSATEENDMTWKEFEKKFGVADVTDANAFEKLGDVYNTVVTERDDLKVAKVTLSAASTKLTDANKELATKLEAATKGNEKPHPQVVKLSCQLLDDKMDKLVTSGKITPAVRKSLGEIFDEKAITVSLSEDPNLTTINKIVAALAENDIIELGEHAAAQVTGLPAKLSSQANGENAHDMLADGMDSIAAEAKALNSDIVSNV